MKPHLPTWLALGALAAGRAAAQQVATIEVAKLGAPLIAGDSVALRAVAKNLSYGYDGLVVLDVGRGIRGGSPTHPVFVTQYKDFQTEFWTHTAWRYKNYVIVGDELFPPSFGPDQPEFPYGYFHIVDVSDWDHPREVARYEVPSGGSHNVWMDGDILYVGYYQGGLRAIDLSGELRGDLVAQGRELAAYYPMDAKGKIPNWPFVWGPQTHKGLVYASDFNSGLWIMKLEPEPAVP